MRNRYLDLLRAAAIIRVIIYHLYGWPWLSILLPAMGIMFALAGSLTAASLAKRQARQVVTSRLRRLLPPLWLLGLVAVPVILAAGWAAETGGEHPFNPLTLVYWAVPVGDPPGSDLAVDVWEPLWYLRAYLWFVLLSPLLFALWRKAGLAILGLPLLLMAVLEVSGLALPEAVDAGLWDFATFGGCWIAGFAHHDGRLARVRPWLAYPAALAMGSVAMWWAASSDNWDLNDFPEAQALWSLAFVLVVLRWQPPMGWLARIGPLDKAVTLINGRAVTIYLWHNIAIAAVWPVLTFVALDDVDDWLGSALALVAALLLTALAVLVFGWAEDLAARRRPRLWPSTAVPAGTSVASQPRVTATGAAPYRVTASVRMPRPHVPGARYGPRGRGR